MKMTLLFVWIGIVLLVVAVVLLALISRAIYLGTRIGAFRAMLRFPDSGRWHRGYARYGRHHLAWASLYSLRVRPNLLLPREKVSIVVQPQDTQWVGAVLLNLKYKDKDYQLLMSQGDYTGLVSWIDSVPPGEVRNH